MRRRTAAALVTPPLSTFERFLKSTEDREISTTMAFVQILQTLIRDKNIGRHVVPIVPDESRTFGMEGMFRQLGIWNQLGQLYTPQDADQPMFYKETKDGQILQEGINEAGAMCDWIAAATSYSTHGVPMIPFYIFYSMFGFQRIGDLAWAAGDMRSRGFLLGGTAGRTTLNGEGLQHEDGHSHQISATVPNCLSYDPTFGYEVAVIIQDGLRRMYAEQEDVYYYLTVMNENYAQPAMPEGAAPNILKGMYLLQAGDRKSKAPRVQLLGSGVILREAIAAAELLRKDWGVEPTSGGAHRSSNSRATATRSRAGTCSTRSPSKSNRTSPRAWPRRRARSSPRPTMCARLPTRSARSCHAVTSYWAPLASDAPTRVKNCAGSSRSTATTLSSPR
jgi:pyruvate dehydrogenase E1 component